jgi:predicted nucleic acid-binding protein
MLDKQTTLFFDTVVLSNFALVEGGVDFLKKRYRNRGAVTLQVLEELAKASFAGWQRFEQLEMKLFVKDGFQKIFLTEEEQLLYLALLKNLGAGEASCIASAFHRKGVVVTDDRVARNFCKERSVAVSGTVGILKAACLDNVLGLDHADQMLSQMISHGFYSPIRKIIDIL